MCWLLFFLHGHSHFSFRQQYATERLRIKAVLIIPRKIPGIYADHFTCAYLRQVYLLVLTPIKTDRTIRIFQQVIIGNCSFPKSLRPRLYHRIPMLLIKIFHRHCPRYIATSQEISITKHADLLSETGFETHLEEERLECGVWGLGFV